MQDDKHFDWPGQQANDDLDDNASTSDDARGTDVLRSWLSRAPTQRRAPLDPSLYTLKGYRQWKEGVSRAWSDKDD